MDRIDGIVCALGFASGLERELGRQDSNLRMPGPKPGALPDLATPHQDSHNNDMSFGYSVSFFFSCRSVPPLSMLTVIL